jgi:hypothetical protein
LSTLTKILIVLLTLSSIFLCGIVVNYVATADNYRQKNEELSRRLQIAVEKQKGADQLLREKTNQYEQEEAKLKKEITSLKIKFDEVQGKLVDAEREKALLLQKVSNMVSSVETTSQTAEQQRQLFVDTFAELNKVQAELIKQKNILDETSTKLLEKMAIIETLDADKKRLLEEKTQLQRRLDQLLLPRGEVAALPTPVTPEKDLARWAAPPPAKEIGLKGLITAVDLKNSMASISVGAADGVKTGMKFYVTRGAEFLCELLIIDVDTKEAVGVLELVQQQPRVGDNVATNL